MAGSTTTRLLLLFVVIVTLSSLWYVTSGGVDDDVVEPELHAVALRTPSVPTNRVEALQRATEDTHVPPPVPTLLPDHPDGNHHACDPVAGDQVVRNWQSDVRDVCHDPQTGIRIREYVQRSFEYKPQLFHFENVDVEYFNGNLLPNPCPPSTYFEEERSNDRQSWAQGEAARQEYNTRNVRLISDRTVIRMRRFDVYNIYEAFHAYINTYFLIQVLQLNQSEVQFAFTDDDCGDSDKDAQWWNSMNHGRFPIVYTKNHGQTHYGMVDGVPYRIKSMVRASSTGTSIICSNHGILRGRSHEHHCKSSAFRAAVAWLRSNFDDRISYQLGRPRADGKVVVLWSSRRPYRRDFDYTAVPRQLPRESEFIVALQSALGSDYIVHNTNFGGLDPHQAVEAASNADVIVGVHGAGLTWSAFLPRHGGIVEIFGGDRGEGNLHYHNIASLADIHYRSMSLGDLHWRMDHVEHIKHLIYTMPLNRRESEPS